MAKGIENSKCWHYLAGLALGTVSIFFTESSLAQLVPDNTLGTENSQVNPIDGNNDRIDGGAARDSNLFHSFQEFNVGEGRGVYFTNPNEINNIFSRVTGSNASNILGTLGVDGAANLYLINPNGIIFGANSSLDVQGSFTATTANEVRFGEQGTFDTINPQPAQLLTVNPTAYFFHQLENQNIKGIESQAFILGGENLTFLGGDIELTGSNLFASGGRIELGSLQDIGEVEINEEGNLTFPDGVTRGDISLSEGSRVVTFSRDILVTTGSLLVTDGTQFFSTTFGGDAGSITINASDSVVLEGEDNDGFPSGIFSSQLSERVVGNAGDIFITTGSLLVTNGAQLFSSTRSQGDAGNINIIATDSVVFDGQNTNPSGIASAVAANAVGNGGDISITTNSLSVTNGAIISPSTLGQGNSGNIFIVTDSLSLSNEGALATITNGQGEGGDIIVNANSLKLDNEGFITSQSLTNFEAGDITLNITGSLKATNNSNIATSSTQSTGGNLTITAKDIELRGNSNLNTLVVSGAGGGGDITLKADSIIAFDDSDIFANAADGNGGNIILDTPAFFGENFTLNSLTSNPDNLGDNNRVDINATGAVSGVVSLPDVSFIQNSLTELPDNAINTDKLVANSCVVPNQKQKGTFIITGNGGLATTPEDESIAPYSTGNVQTIEEDNSYIWQPGDPIIEPQQLYRLSNGKLILSRECSQH